MVSASLHPAVRRKLASATPAAHAHDAILRPLAGLPMILAATEQDFIGALLADLETDTWRDALVRRAASRRGRDATLELSQPVHRRFHLVMLEAVCHEPGSPRLDPQAIASMGFVLRRRNGAGWQGWMRAGSKRRGWMPLAMPDADPDPALRQPSRAGAAGVLDALLATRRGSATAASEEVHPLFVAPPNLCAKLGLTILFGLIPTASAELSEAPTAAPNYAAMPAAEAEAMRQHLSGYLKARPKLAMPRVGETLDPAWAPLDGDVDENSESDAGRLKAFALFLQQLALELGAFETTPAATAMMSLLARIRLPLQKDARGRVIRDIAASDFVRGAKDVLLGREVNATGLTMPLEWPAISQADGTALTNAALACLSARFAELVPNAPKFEGDDEQYAIRAFMRVVRHPECPPHLVWAPWSDQFRILPWWAGDAPPTRVSLPNTFDRQVLKSMKPGVSFALPPPLAKLLNGDPKKLRDGEQSGGGGDFDIAWLCSFSIPIITLCAFIVLNIFLRLFDLIFKWMLFIKICIPIPKRRQP
jgi:hypothetical protein